MLTDDNGEQGNTTLGDWALAEFSKKDGSAFFTASDHCSLVLKSLARVSSMLLL